ncbi:GerAB/ArcD/ProY family transporter [Bacillus pseudomycoides]|uniref:GerAB/ArcD/ProY family transporter n=1 Tax=Bacillus pseudomycoides TaxID=64104 RepID=UPI0004EDA0FB|nr:GerAB/ArcD/ProY family transporter [Bacillus pseudomycoides]AIK40214.1 spore germination family protein [Bacillus pseudomycoides]AJI15949.1 spore germination family protein [Bacillus pseudomycoides]PEB43048.1 spore gernimation protein GerB [Bacillus pseudomycoides]PEM39877.1 spore gernimation protein GerB [Bacillus pseudomycoides]PGD97250.1 spore gernimation protein GerB [Bacillus pseudomycoides]
MNTRSKELTVSPYFAFFLVHSLQIGVGILGFQRILIKSAGYDAWISLILMGFATHIVLFCMLAMLEKDNDLINIHTTCFGKWIGSFFSLCFTAYFLLFCLTILQTYIEVIQVWVFPTLKSWKLNVLFLFIIFYVIKGGFRSVTGICFWGIIIPFFVIFFLIFPMKYAHFRNILPILTHSPLQIFQSAKDSILEFLGFEALLFVYPLIEKGKSLKRWAHGGIALTTIIYVILALISFMYFSEGLLQRTIWATLTMLKIIKIPFIQRFEYIIIFVWFLIILPNLCVTIWSSCQSMKRSFHIPFRFTLPFFIFVVYIASLFIINREHINTLNTLLSRAGLYIVYVYIPLLFLWHSIRWRLKNKQNKTSP